MRVIRCTRGGLLRRSARGPSPTQGGINSPYRVGSPGPPPYGKQRATSAVSGRVRRLAHATNSSDIASRPNELIPQRPRRMAQSRWGEAHPSRSSATAPRKAEMRPFPSVAIAQGARPRQRARAPTGPRRPPRRPPPAVRRCKWHDSVCHAFRCQSTHLAAMLNVGYSRQQGQF